VELLRRGCDTVYCFDASGNKPFAALGDAIALARSELEVEIEIDPSPLLPSDGTGLAAESCVVGKISSRSDTDELVEVGRLVYVPTVVTAAAPWDVHAYRQQDPVFPHHSTAGQLYTDQRFEPTARSASTPATPPGRSCGQRSRRRRRTVRMRRSRRRTLVPRPPVREAGERQPTTAGSLQPESASSSGSADGGSSLAL